MLIEGNLRKNDCGRWEIVSNDTEREVQLTSGSVCEVLVASAIWVKTRIESANGEYYAVAAGVELYAGQSARIEY